MFAGRSVLWLRDVKMGELLGAVFSVRSVPRPYDGGQLPVEESLETAVRRIGVS
jgi:hypothetical protein